MIYKTGDNYYAEFTTSRPSSGEALNADSLPVATATRNGADDAAFVLTVTNMATGRYKVTGTVPAYSLNDIVQVSIAATVDGIAGVGVIDGFRIVAIQTGDAYALGNAGVKVSVGTGAGQVNLSGGKVPATLAAADASGNLPAQVKAIDNIDFPALQLAALSAATPAVTVSDKTGFALTTGERTAIANEVEAQIIDETDSEKVLTAITNKIAAVNPSLSGLTLAAIASQVRTELATELARIDAAISSRTKPADTQARVTLVDTVTANTDMRGTDNAAKAGNAMALTSGERTTLATAIEAALLNDLDGQALVAAIAAAVKAAVWSATNRKLTSALTDETTPVNMSGTMVLPVMGARVYTATATEQQETVIMRGDTPRIPFDLKADYTSWTAVFGARAKADDAEYVIAEKTCTWIDQTKGTGYVDLNATDTADVGSLVAEIELRSGASRLTAMVIYMTIQQDTVRESV